MRGFLGISLLAFCLLVKARDYDHLSPTPSSSLTDAFTDSSDETAAASSLSDSASRNNNDWLTDDDDDDDDENMDESPLNVKPAAKSSAKPTPKPSSTPLTTTQVEDKVLEYLNAGRRLFGGGPLIRSATLDIGAKVANDKMQKLGQIKKDASIKHGQLQCIKLTSSDKVAPECLSTWITQMRDYDWSKPALTDKSKFFVTAVYKAATHAGVACKKGPKGKYFVFVLLDPAPDAAKLKNNVKGYTDLFTSVAGAKCSTGFTDYGGTCYKFHKDQQTWMNANVECAKELAVLPAVGSRGENEFFKQGLLKDQKGFTWLGFNDRLAESMYMAVDGSQIRFMDWVNGQPTGKKQNCVGFDNTAKYGTMADYACTTPSTYVCKKPLEGDITYIVKLVVESMVWLNDFSNSGSLAYQQLAAKFQKAMQEVYKKAGIKVLKSLSIQSVSNGLPPQPAPAPPVYSYLGKRQVTAIRVTPAPTTPPKAKPSGGATGKPTPAKPTKKVPTTKPKAKVTVKLALTFGPSGLPLDPTAALQQYLKANGNKLPAPLNELIKLKAIKIAPPGTFTTTMPCPPICSTSCISSCAPSCCYAPAPRPCVPTPTNPCPPPQAAAPTQPPRQTKVQAKRPASKCFPSPGTTCAPAPLYPPPVYPQYPPPSPCVPTVANNWCRSNVLAKPLAVNRFVRRPVTYRYPLQPYRRIVPRLVSSRPVSRAVLPVPQAGGYGCIQPPCPPPIMMPPAPLPPPQPMMPPPMMPPPMMPQFPMMPSPCGPTPLSPCPPKPPPQPKKPAGKVVKPKMVKLQGCTYPPCSMITLPAPPPVPMPLPPMPMPMPVPPCGGLFNPPCPPPSPPKAGSSKSKSTAPKPCSPTPTNPCAPPMPMQMPMPMLMPPMPVPPMSMPMPMPMPCGPANPCAKPPPKPKPPKPMTIKLPAIQIQVPQQPPMMPPMGPPMPCPPVCGSLPACPAPCPKPCCKFGRRSVQLTDNA